MSHHVVFEVNNRPDYVRVPGREVWLRVGPFGFAVCTADGLQFAFSFRVGESVWYWDLSRGEPR